MIATYVKCTHTKGNRIQECIVLLVADRMGCIPIGPAENAIAKLAAGLAMTAVGVVKVRLGSAVIDASQLATAEDLDAAVEGSGGFHLGAHWTYRTGVPVIGTMLMHGNETITTRERVPPEMLAKLTPSRAALSAKPVKVLSGIGIAILAVAAIVYAATGNLDVLFGIGFWGALLIAISLSVWMRMRATPRPGPTSE